jgi:hypothetical protein
MAVHHGEVLLDEPDHLPIKPIAWVVGITFAHVFLFLPVALFILWKMTAYDEKAIDVGMADPRRLEYIRIKEAVLSSGGALTDGQEQIPITQAMEIVIQQSKK